MSYQNDRFLSLRWYVGILAICFVLWAWMVSYATIMLELRDTVWFIKALSWGSIVCVVVAMILPKEGKYEKKTRQKSKNESNDTKY